MVNELVPSRSCHIEPLMVQQKNRGNSMKLLVINIQLALIEAILAFVLELKFFSVIVGKIWTLSGKTFKVTGLTVVTTLGVLVYCLFLVAANLYQILFKEIPAKMSGLPTKTFNALVKQRATLLATKQTVPELQKDPKTV